MRTIFPPIASSPVCKSCPSAMLTVTIEAGQAMSSRLGRAGWVEPAGSAKDKGRGTHAAQGHRHGPRPHGHAHAQDGAGTAGLRAVPPYARVDGASGADRLL